MQAIVITAHGAPEVLQLREVPRPDPVRGEVRVRVRATAINRADLLQRVGAYPAPPGVPADIPGLEFAGEVDAVGESVTEWMPGDRVYGLVGGGSYAEYLVAPERTLAAMPRGMSFTDAAAVPEAFITAWDAMVVQGRLAAGETALVSAVGSGVGTAAVQIARAIGARSVGTVRASARGDDKLARARDLGMDVGLSVEGACFADAVRAASGGDGVDVVLELVGGPYVSEDLGCLRAQGRLILVGLMAGMHADLDLGLILRRRLELRGTVMRARPLEEKIAATQLLARQITPLLERGLLRPVVHQVLPLANAAEAHALVAGNDTFGKVVLQS